MEIKKMLDKPIVYIGPNLPKYGVTYCQIFCKEMPNNVLSLIDDCKEAKELFVPSAQLSRAISNLHVIGTLENKMFGIVSSKMMATKH